jgi:murein DD-endopeptidase MepM/ murein hydrolase activator NlpD
MSSHAAHSASDREFQQSVHSHHLKRERAERRIIFAHGRSVQVIRVAPWLGILLVLCVLAGVGAVIASASYLFFRDELFTASIKRQHQIQVAYEDRISDLRREIDRITSRQLLNQQAYEAQVERLLSEHTQLSAQSERLDGLLDQAGVLGLVPRRMPPSPVLPPSAQTGQAPLAPAALGRLAPDDSLFTGSISPQLPPLRGLSTIQQAVSDPPSVLRVIEQAVDAQGHNQVIAMAGLAAVANEESDGITAQLAAVGVRISLPSMDEEAGTGMVGPLLAPLAGGSQFEAYAQDAARALDDLQAARLAIDTVPVAAPARNARLTSRFGNRRDPFTRRAAFHSGIDYAAPTGHPVYAPADGVVTGAGRQGGYGIMVEIDHAHGLSTRFAHLSRASVTPGTRVRAGDQIGLIGSTGRSTGPHLHYEIRRNERAVDPMPFVRAGQAIDAL